jgi:hypothetical protein
VVVALEHHLAQPPAGPVVHEQSDDVEAAVLTRSTGVAHDRLNGCALITGLVDRWPANPTSIGD